MTISCEFYGTLREITAKRKISLENEGIEIKTLIMLIKVLITHYPKLETYFTADYKPKKEIIVLINEIDANAFDNSEIEIDANASIVFIPTIHGG